MSLSQCTKNFDHIMFGCRVMALTKRQVILRHNFCPFTPLVSLTIKILQNKCLEKLWCYTSVPKLGSHDFWLNRCGFGQMNGTTEKGMEGRIKEVTYRGGYLKPTKRRKSIKYWECPADAPSLNLLQSSTDSSLQSYYKRSFYL